MNFIFWFGIFVQNFNIYPYVQILANLRKFEMGGHCFEHIGSLPHLPKLPVVVVCWLWALPAHYCSKHLARVLIWDINSPPTQSKHIQNSLSPVHHCTILIYYLGLFHPGWGNLQACSACLGASPRSQHANMWALLQSPSKPTTPDPPDPACVVAPQFFL